MKRFFIFVYFLALTVMSGYSQNDWKTGYIIKNSGDTVFGMIENRDSKANSNHCYFRKDEVSETFRYGPTELEGYRIHDGKFYVSKNIAGGDSIRKLFLEFLIEGRVNVFHYKDDKSHFFIEKEGKLHELINTTIIKEINGTKYFIDQKEYLGLLNSLMKDANIESFIDKSRLESKSLIKIAKNYHERVCTNEQCIIYEKKIKPVHATLGFHIGESINRFNFGDELISDYRMSSYLGCRVEFENIINYSENLTLQVDLNVQKFSKYNFKEKFKFTTISYNGSYYTIYDETYTNGQKDIDIDLKAVVLKLPVVVNYTFSKGKIRPYLGLGISNTVVVSQNKDFIYTIFYHEFNQSIPTYLLGFVGRLGCKYVLKNNHAIYTDLNIDYSRNININQFNRLTNNLYSFTVGYSL
jgi:hypothetical protein